MSAVCHIAASRPEALRRRVGMALAAVRPAGAGSPVVNHNPIDCKEKKYTQKVILIDATGKSNCSNASRPLKAAGAWIRMPVTVSEFTPGRRRVTGQTPQALRTALLGSRLDAFVPAGMAGVGFIRPSGPTRPARSSDPPDPDASPPRPPGPPRRPPG